MSLQNSKVKIPKQTKRVLEREIDEIVYQLYGLTEEEIAIIEESIKQK